MTQKKESSALKFLYKTFIGRVVLKILTSVFVSKLCGKFLDSKLSKPLIKRFVNNNNIDLNEFESDDFSCFNDCFCRKIKDGKRPFDEENDGLISPCDGLLSAFKISDDTVLSVKQSKYKISSLVEDENLALKYRNGICLVFRLCVNHYHRYCYPTDGQKGENIFIKGILHTVRPIALETEPVYVKNCREYTVINTDKFGDIVQMEVGAMLVGKIKNNHGKCAIQKGQEKGMFLYGGSTVILLLEDNRAEIHGEIFKATEEGREIPVKMGQSLKNIKL